jgi:hypothetical protein
MNSNGFFIFIICVLFSPFTLSQSPSTQNSTNITNSENEDLFFLCKNGKYSRWLRAFKLDNGKCHTTYSKDGYLQIISSATYFTSCEGVLHNVRKNIEEGGYKCSKLEKYFYLDLE